ncbi:transporter substrate-binding domain-containing protein [Sulfurospirillum sp. 1612]|uniref:transporter substrate-binding domain-containing protein n=1 Tax=Sulfurospirillum sp. 1612 TaxID=3094835 RepID=UPI002F95F0C8
MIKLLCIGLFLQINVWAAVDIGLTQKEKDWLAQHPSITVGIDRNYAPFEFQDSHGEFKGIAIDYLAEIKKMLNIKINIVTAKTWKEVTELARDKSVDVLSCIAPTHKRGEYLLFTHSYLSFPMAIVTNKIVGYVDGLRELNGKTVAVIDDYMSHHILEEFHKDIFLVKTENLTQGLNLVLAGKTYAYVGNLSQIAYSIQNDGFQNLAISGIAKYRFDYAMGVRDDAPILRDILQKCIHAIPQEVKDNIYCQWFPPLFQKAVDYTLVWQISAFGAILIGIFLYWTYRLKKEIKKRKATENSLKRNREWLNCSLQSAKIGAWDWDIPQKTITGNSVFAALIECSNNEISMPIDQFQKEFIHQKDLPAVIQHIEECFNSTDEFCRIQFRIISQSGALKYVESRSRIFKYDRYNNPIRMIGFIKELTPPLS